MELMPYQIEAARNLSSGKVLYGQVGRGKTATVLQYYVDNEEYRPIYVITTAKKRDSLDWEEEAAKFGIGTDESCYGKLTVDSWNNISKYIDVEDAFFVFDEQRVVGRGAWVKAFLKIARGSNHWVLLSATPGDTWMDYAPLFIANGYFKNITQFKVQHVKAKPYMNYFVVDSYINESKLERLRNEILVEMRHEIDSRRILNWWDVGHDEALFRRVVKDRWHVYEDRPILNAAELFRVMRRVVNSDPSRLEAIFELKKTHPRLIIFYNFDYELEILRTLGRWFEVAEYNGHVKQPVPSTDEWMYLVQYQAGAEGWNCVDTDAMILYSLNYSFKLFEQAQGRIDRMNSPFEKLFYYVLYSNSFIDRIIRNALQNKENFNEMKIVREWNMADDFDPLEVCEMV